jgi:hypothetical protein
MDQRAIACFDQPLLDAGLVDDSSSSCNLKQLLAAIGTNYLPQVHKTPAISSLNLPHLIVFWNH